MENLFDAGRRDALLARIQRLDSREYQEFRRGLLARTTVASRAGSN